MKPAGPATPDVSNMSSLEIAASPPIRRDETVQISLLLAFAGGYLDAYIWIIHGVMANSQTANLVLLWDGRMDTSPSLCSSDSRINGGHRHCSMAASRHRRPG